MAKLKRVVDRAVFETAISNVEANGALANRSVLNTAIEAEYNKLCPSAPITAPIVGLRLAEFGLLATLKTPVGKRGRPAGVKNAKTAPVTPTVAETPSATETTSEVVPVEIPIVITPEAIPEVTEVTVPQENGVSENVPEVTAA